MASDSQTKAEEAILMESYNSLGWKLTLKVIQKNLLLYSKAPVWNYFLLEVVKSVVPATALNWFLCSSFPSTRWEAHLNLTIASPNLSREHNQLLKHFSRTTYPTYFPERAVSPGYSQSNSTIGKHLCHIFKYWDRKKSLPRQILSSYRCWKYLTKKEYKIQKRSGISSVLLQSMFPCCIKGRIMARKVYFIVMGFLNNICFIYLRRT